MTMWSRRLGLLAVGMALGACSNGDTAKQADQTATQAARPAADTAPEVVLATTKGTIVIRLFPKKAPVTVANFLRHVHAHFYDGLIFHRVLRDFMIQTGAYTPDLEKRVSSVFPIENEADNGLKNVRGAVAMARTSDPNSATSQFFIDLKNNPALDFRARTIRGWGYAVFGQVVQGMDVVDKIALVPTKRTAEFQAIPTVPVVIDSAYVRSAAASAATP